MKWRNFNLAVRIKISTGTALLIYLVAFFGVLVSSRWLPAVAANMLAVLGTLTLGIGGYLKQQDSSNKLDVEAAKNDLGDKISRIKMAAMGVPNGEAGGKTGDPLT
jgi:hypothetical protein